jgi:hypothetical protein
VSRKLLIGLTVCALSCWACRRDVVLLAREQNLFTNSDDCLAYSPRAANSARQSINIKLLAGSARVPAGTTLYVEGEEFGKDSMGYEVVLRDGRRLYLHYDGTVMKHTEGSQR